MIKFIISEIFFRSADKNVTETEIKIEKEITDRKMTRRIRRETNDQV
jgi:hypothetical protein